MSTKTPNAGHPAATEKHLTAAIQAAQTLLQPAPRTYDLGGKSVTRDQLVSLLQGLVAPYTSADSLRSQLKAAVQSRNGAAASTNQSLKDLESLVVSALGSQGTALTQFGFKAPKARTPLTSEQAHAKAVKTQLTRTARGTMGKVQRKAVTGITPPQVVFTANVVPGTATQEPSPGAPASNGTVSTKAPGTATSAK
jgi:hypothetical protein